MARTFIDTPERKSKTAVMASRLSKKLREENPATLLALLVRHRNRMTDESVSLMLLRQRMQALRNRQRARQTFAGRG